MKHLRTIMLFFLLFSLACSPPGPEGKVFQETFFAFDTIITITVTDRSMTREKFKVLMKDLHGLTRRYDLIFNNYNPRSQVRQLENLKAGEWAKVSSELYGLLVRCKRYYEWTDGAFDITIGRITRLYDFHRDIMPDKNEIRTNLRFVGMNKVELADHRIRVLKQGMVFDLGGIAKGYIVDRFTDLIRSRGFRHFIVNIGGDLYASGRNEQGKEWIIGIQHPRIPGEIIRKIRVFNKAVITSGDYERYLLRGKRRYHHILDPRTGTSASNDIRSVTIVGPDAETATYITKVFFVQGLSRGEQFIKKRYRGLIEYYIY